jgi:DNA-binding beta-propeller fold protein YncE
MKMKFTSQIILFLSFLLLTDSCKDEGFPVPPASTVPLFSYMIDNDGFAPATVTFINESITPEPAGVPSYTWSFGDGSGSTEESPTHLYTSSGVFSVKLVVKMTISMEIKELSKDILIKNANATGIPVFFTDGSLIYTGYLNSDQPVFSTLPVGPFQDSYGLTIDTVNSKLYIGDFDAKKIYQCNLDGTDLIEFRTSLPGPDGLTIDYEGGKLYWDTDDGIQRADLSSTDINQKEDFVTGQINDPEGVSIDPVNRKLYWTNYNGGVWMKNLDGTGETEIIPDIEGGSTLVIGNKLYFDQWIGTGDIHLKSANLDGTGISTITTGISKVVFGLAYDAEGGKIYWGDRTPGRIRRGNTDGSEIETWYEKTGSSPRGIVFGKKK